MGYADPATQPPNDEWILPIIRELVQHADLSALTASNPGSYWCAAVATGVVADEALVDALATRSRMRVASTLMTSTEARDHVPERLARRYGVLPLSVSGGTLDVATCNPYNLECEQMLAFVASKRVRMLLASPIRITERLDEVYRPTTVVERLLASAAPLRVAEIRSGHADIGGDTDLGGIANADSPILQPITRLVNHIVAEGISAGASDIHVEAEEGVIAVRHRIDGVLRRALTLPKEIGLPLVSRVKIMARMDIADRLRPQGGRASVTVDGERIDLRVSTLPAAHGEKVVIRILDSRGSVRSLDALGLNEWDAPQLRRLLEIREGLVLVTGPTGSGKTTTLYAALQRLLERGLNIVTVEDPVEYRVAGIVQVQVNEKAGLTFAAALRSILRQDPDVILVGEIRDRETAAIAVQAALTGHLVLATLHTIDATSSITRMHDLGMAPAKIAAALKGVIAQRLLRRTCAGCARASDDPIPSTLWSAIPTGARLTRGAGCQTCSGTGYRGRVAVIELLALTSDLTELIARSAPITEFRARARENGVRSLWASGIAHVLSGTTTVDEITRVLEPDATTPAEEESGPDSWDDHGAVSPDDAYLRNECESVYQHQSTGPIAMTTLRVGVVDVYVIDPNTTPWRVLTLQRASGTRCPGAWEAVHGHIEDGESPEIAAVREVREETGLTIERLYNVTVHAFYLHQIQTVEMAVVFCAFADSSREVTLGSEHAAYEWLAPDQAADRCIWPRATQALHEIEKLLGRGSAGPAEDVLRVL